jgi:uncharacterized membrane protein YkoI
MAAGIEKNCDALLELELTLRGGKLAYKADMVAGGKKVVAYFDAADGKEIGREYARELDGEEARVYYGYGAAAPLSAPRGETAADAAARAQASYLSEAKVSYEKAREIALDKTGGGAVEEIELDYERGLLVYEIEIRRGGVEYEVCVNAVTGDVAGFWPGRTSGQGPPRYEKGVPGTDAAHEKAGKITIINYEKAAEIAVARIGGGYVKKMELELYARRLVYKVEVQYEGLEYDVLIDAATGEALGYAADD